MKKLILTLITSLALCAFSGNLYACDSEPVKPPTAEEMVEITTGVTSLSAVYAQSKIAEASKFGLQAEEVLSSLRIAVTHLDETEANEMAVIILTSLIEEVNSTYVEARLVFTEGILRVQLADLMARHAATNVEQLDVATEFCKSGTLFEATIGMLREVIETSERGLAIYNGAIAESE